MTARETLAAELRRHALVLGEVTLTSGATAQYYVAAKRAILRPAGFRALATVIILGGLLTAWMGFGVATGPNAPSPARALTFSNAMTPVQAGR